MKSGAMMKEVQREKVLATVEMLCKSNFHKEQFMKEFMPVQSVLIQRLENVSNLTSSALNKICTIFKEQKELEAHILNTNQKFMLSNHQAFKVNEKKNPNQQFGPQQWNRNILRVLQGMSKSHLDKVNALKGYSKILDSTLSDITKQQKKYTENVKQALKEIHNHFVDIDTNEKQQNKIIARITKDSKSKDPKTSIFYLSEIKKVEIYYRRQFNSYAKRSQAILAFMKSLVKWQKQASKKIKEIFTVLLARRKQIYRESKQGQTLVGLLTVLEDNIQESRQLYFEKTLLDQQLIKKMTTLVPPQKSKVHHLIKFLNLESNFLIEKASPEISFKSLTANVSFKNFDGVSLAQGWIMTTYTPADAYLTYDHVLAMFDKQGNLLQNIHSESTKINKVQENNIVFIEERTKGFFRESVSEYKLKFDETDRMEEFILFIQNQIV